jgi:Zn-dependent protease with chaperone function
MSMKRTVLTWGLISGAVSAGLLLATIPFADAIGFDKGEILGYTTMVASALFVYFGVRSYREKVNGGKLGFGRGFQVGLLIAIVACLCYVAAWEVAYFKFMPDFADKYAAHAIAKARAAGASPAKLAEITRQMRDFRALYDNPWMNAAITFVEPFPIFFGATIVSALALRKR